MVSGLDVDLERGQDADDAGVEAEGHDEVHQRALPQLRPQRVERGGRDPALGGAFARGLQDEAVQCREVAFPPLAVRDQRADVRVRDAELGADLDVVRPLEGRPRDPAYLEDRQFAQARVERRFAVPDVAAEALEGAGHAGAVHELAVEVDVAGEEVLVLRGEVVAVEVGEACHAGAACPVTGSSANRSPGRAWGARR